MLRIRYPLVTALTRSLRPVEGGLLMSASSLVSLPPPAPSLLPVEGRPTHVRLSPRDRSHQHPHYEHRLVHRARRPRVVVGKTRTVTRVNLVSAMAVQWQCNGSAMAVH